MHTMNIPAVLPMRPWTIFGHKAINLSFSGISRVRTHPLAVRRSRVESKNQDHAGKIMVLGKLG